MYERVKSFCFSSLIIFAVSTSASAAGPAEQVLVADPTAELDLAYPYRLIPTTNIWTHILLDTATGRTWQVNYSVDDAPSVRTTIHGTSLLPEGQTPRNGRFALYPTENMYNFLLLDRIDSRLWQLQWAFEAENRGIMRSIPLVK